MCVNLFFCASREVGKNTHKCAADKTNQKKLRLIQRRGCAYNFRVYLCSLKTIGIFWQFILLHNCLIFPIYFRWKNEQKYLRFFFTLINHVCGTAAGRPSRAEPSEKKNVWTQWLKMFWATVKWHYMLGDIVANNDGFLYTFSAMPDKRC